MAIVFEDGTSTTRNGSIGNDIFSGGIGSDRYSGGDVFNMVVDKNLDTIAGGEGTDRLSYGNADRAVTVSLSDTGAGSVTSEYLLFQFRDPNGVWHQVNETVQVATVSGVENVGGTRFNDTISGNVSANTITGGDGNDTLDGKGGNDILKGGFGADTLTGGEGFDTFVFSNVADSRFIGTAEYSDLDTITDFKYGQDKIDLSQIDADLTVSGNQAFEFATGAFTGGF